jgi:hypothetical protein
MRLGNVTSLDAILRTAIEHERLQQAEDLFFSVSLTAEVFLETSCNLILLARAAGKVHKHGNRCHRLYQKSCEGPGVFSIPALMELKPTKPSEMNSSESEGVRN